MKDLTPASLCDNERLDPCLDPCDPCLDPCLRWIREDRAKEQQKRLSARASEQETQTGKPPAKPDSPPLDTTAQRHRLLAPGLLKLCKNGSL